MTSNATSNVESSVICPSCGAGVPVDAGYPSWCEGCGWNVDPYPPKPPTTRAQRAATRSLARIDEMYKTITTSDAVGRAASASKTKAYALAVGVHAVSAALLGLLVWAVAWPGLFLLVRVLFALVFALLLVAVLPRPQRPLRQLNVVDRARAPQLWQLIDRVAQAVGAPAPRYVAIEPALGFGSAVCGVRRRRVLIVGAASWLTLTPEERVAALGRELVTARGSMGGRAVISGAIGSLQRWGPILRVADLKQWESYRLASGIVTSCIEQRIYASFLMPHGMVEDELAGGLFDLATLVPRNLVRPYMRALLTSTALADQPLFLAGDLASAAAGSTAGAVGLLRDSALESVVALDLERAQRAGKKEWQQLVSSVTSLPAREVERLQRVDRLRAARTDDAHAATSARIDVLLARPATAAKVYLGESDDAAVRAELVTFAR